MLNNTLLGSNFLQFLLEGQADLSNHIKQMFWIDSELKVETRRSNIYPQMNSMEEKYMACSQDAIQPTIM